MARRFREVKEGSETEKLRELEAEQMRLRQQERQREREIWLAAENLRLIGEEERRILEMTKRLYDKRPQLGENEFKARQEEIERMKKDLREETQSYKLTIDDEYVHAIATGYATFGNKTSAKFEEQMKDVLGDSKLKELRDWVDGVGKIQRGLFEDPYIDEEPEQEEIVPEEMDDLLSLEELDDVEIDLEDLSHDYRANQNNQNAPSVEEQKLKDLEKEIEEEKARVAALQKEFNKKEEELRQAVKEIGDSHDPNRFEKSDKIYEELQRMRNQIADMTRGIESKERFAQELREVVATQGAIAMDRQQPTIGNDDKEIELEDLEEDIVLDDLDNLDFAAGYVDAHERKNFGSRILGDPDDLLIESQDGPDEISIDPDGPVEHER